MLLTDRCTTSGRPVRARISCQSNVSLHGVPGASERVVPVPEVAAYGLPPLLGSRCVPSVFGLNSLRSNW